MTATPSTPRPSGSPARPGVVGAFDGELRGPADPLSGRAGNASAATVDATPLQALTRCGQPVGPGSCIHRTVENRCGSWCASVCRSFRSARFPHDIYRHYTGSDALDGIFYSCSNVPRARSVVPFERPSLALRRRTGSGPVALSGSAAVQCRGRRRGSRRRAVSFAHVPAATPDAAARSDPPPHTITSPRISDGPTQEKASDHGFEGRGLTGRKVNACARVFLAFSKSPHLHDAVFPTRLDHSDPEQKS
jgi:hypothetical protein